MHQDVNPSRAENVYLIQGNVNDDTLTRANIQQATTVLILGDDKLDDIARDAKVILSTLTVESLNQAAVSLILISIRRRYLWTKSN